MVGFLRIVIIGFIVKLLGEVGFDRPVECGGSAIDQARHAHDVAQDQAEMNRGGRQATRRQAPRQDPPRPTMASPDGRQGPGTHRS